MKWQVHFAKSVVRRLVPFDREVRSIKRRVFGHTHDVKDTVCSGAFDQLEILAEADIDIEGKTVLEVGSGWLPVIPLIYRAAGAKRVILTDMDSLLDESTLHVAHKFLAERAEWVGEKIGVAPDLIRDRLAIDPEAGFRDALEGLGLRYEVPFDYSNADQSVDVVCSHTVLEHIPPEILTRLLRDWKRILKPGGVILHGIDHSDHRANVDRSLSRVDFLRYSDQAWRFLTLDPQDYCNRLRHHEYMQMIDDAGYEVMVERPWVGPKALRALEKGLPLADRFKGVPLEELATMWSYVMAR